MQPQSPYNGLLPLLQTLLKPSNEHKLLRLDSSMVSCGQRGWTKTTNACTLTTRLGIRPFDTLPFSLEIRVLWKDIGYGMGEYVRYE